MLDSVLEQDVAEVLIDEATLRAKVAELGARITEDYRDRQVTLVSVLKGALPFMADLMRAIALPVRIDLMEVSSYGSATETSGQVRILKDLSSSIEGRDVLIVEDIIDTGLTLNYLTELPARQGAPQPAHLRPARQAGAATRGDRHRLPRIRDPRPLRHRLRPRLRRGLPQPALHRRPAAGGLRRRVRRGLGRGRTLIAVGSVLAICSIPLAWLQAGGTVLEVAASTGQGGGLPVLAMFVASVAMLAIMLVPFATRSGSFWLDRGTSYLALVVLGLSGLVAKVIELLGTEGSTSLAPLDAPGLWLAVAGMALATWGVLELLAERGSGRT